MSEHLCPTGRIVYVVGPSGAGKDSILNGARARLPRDVAVAFAHRYITRPMDAGGENHIALTEEEFSLRLSRGLFVLHWYGNGHAYGIGSEVDHWRKAGLTVVINGSRGYLAEAVGRYPDLLPVAITVPPEVLRERLERRGRENAQEIEVRLKRAADFGIDHPALHILRNDGPLEQAVESFLGLLRMVVPS